MVAQFIRFLKQEQFGEQKTLCVHGIKSHPEGAAVTLCVAARNLRPFLITYYLFTDFVAHKNVQPGIQGTNGVLGIMEGKDLAWRKAHPTELWG